MRTRHPYFESRYADQLELVRPSRERLIVPALPAGYTMRAFDDRDEPAYEELFDLAWPDEGALDHTRRHALPGGFLVVEHDASHQLVSSCVAFSPESPERHPDDGSLGWLVTDPAHAGRGLATVIVSTVTNLLLDAAYERPWLQTEDDRTPAISLYLRLGWQPHLYTAAMEARWRTIFDTIGEEFKLSRCVR